MIFFWWVLKVNKFYFWHSHSGIRLLDFVLVAFIFHKGKRKMPSMLSAEVVNMMPAACSEITCSRNIHL